MHTHPLNQYADSLSNLAAPQNITTLWTFGSMAGLFLTIQIITGIFLAMFFAAESNISYESVMRIQRDINNGWTIRNIHANGASFFFLILYIHIGRGLYYNSYNYTEVWLLGVTLFFLTILTAFIGYVLPWGQISFWAATVITNLVSTIPYLGTDLVQWLWGDFSVSNATLNRFYAFHYLFPFVIAAISLLHIVFLHTTGSNNPLGVNTNTDLKFHPYFTINDFFGMIIIWSLLAIMVFFYPTALIDPENYIPANQLVTPAHIQPEWYFLPMYAILRSIPNNLGGVIALVASIAILYILPLNPNNSSSFSLYQNIAFWWTTAIFLILIYIGANPVEQPFEAAGQTITILYFLIYIAL